LSVFKALFILLVFREKPPAFRFVPFSITIFHVFKRYFMPFLAVFNHYYSQFQAVFLPSIHR